MRIGTLTYHRADNYGAVFQAYALQEYLQTLGHKVEVIDYWPNHHANVYKCCTWDTLYFSKLSFKSKIWYIRYVLLCSIRRYKRHRAYNSFRNKEMHIVKPSNDSIYDAVFYGSDTIWNEWKLNRGHVGFDSTYWGNQFINARYKFSYAPSMGNVIDTIETKLYCDKMLPNFRKISVRETSLKNKLYEWGWREVEKTIDPTFLLPKSHWAKLSSQRIVRQDYVLCYNLEQSNVITQLAFKVSQEKNLKIIYLTAQPTADFDSAIKQCAGPYEFLSLFRYAAYVVTSSFHGVAFSLIMEKQFCFHSNTETERISSLLSACGIDNRFIQTPETSFLYSPIDYSSVNKSIDLQRSVSIEFINNCLMEVTTYE